MVIQERIGGRVEGRGRKWWIAKLVFVGMVCRRRWLWWSGREKKYEENLALGKMTNVRQTKITCKCLTMNHTFTAAKK